MADRTVDNDMQEVPQIDEMLESLMLQVMEEAQTKMEEGKELVPMTAVVIGKSVFEETHSGDIDECFASAQDTVKGMDNAAAYCFCYDGFLESDQGDIDCIICEGGRPGDAAGIALALIYHEGEEGWEFEEEVAFLGDAPNFLEDAEPVEYVGEEYTEVSEDEE